MNGGGQEDTHPAIERVARESYGRLVACISSPTRDVVSAKLVDGTRHRNTRGFILMSSCLVSPLKS
jgi:hypothetical protein